MGLRNLVVGRKCFMWEFERVIPEFPDYFRFDIFEGGYVLAKKPSRELIDFCKKEADILDICKIRNQDEYERRAAEHLASTLSEDDKKTILEDPKYSLYHLDFGMYIRNTYYYGRKLHLENDGFIKFPDDISASIFYDLVEILKEQYGNGAKAPKQK